MFTDDEHELFRAALEQEPAEAVTLLAAYRVLVPKLEQLTPDGWLLQGADLIPVVAGLYDRVDQLDETIVASAHYDDGEPASDEAVLAELGPGTLYAAHPETGRKLHQSPIVREVHQLRERVRQAESKAGVVVTVDADGSPVYTVLG